MTATKEEAEKGQIHKMKEGEGLSSSKGKDNGESTENEYDCDPSSVESIEPFDSLSRASTI